MAKNIYVYIYKNNLKHSGVTEQNMKIFLYANPFLFAKRPYQLVGARALKAFASPPA